MKFLEAVAVLRSAEKNVAMRADYPRLGRLGVAVVGAPDTPASGTVLDEHHLVEHTMESVRGK